MNKRTGAGTWRKAEHGGIEAMFEGEYCQILTLSRTRWSYPDQEKNGRFRLTEKEDGDFIILADRHFDAAVGALRDAVVDGRLQTFEDRERFRANARAVLEAIDEEKRQ